MLYRVVVGDATQVRAIVELELAEYHIAPQGELVIYAEGTPARVIGTWAPGRWHSIMEVESWNKARKAGTGDENSRGRWQARQTQAL